MSTQEATIRRGVRNARYSTIPNHVFEDLRLSMEARWLLGYLLSKPDNWIVRVRDIRNVGNCGRDKATAMVNELIAAGYAEREQLRDGGKFGSTVLVIYDEPRPPETQENEAVAESVASLSQTCLPAPAEPYPVLPGPANPTHSKDLEIAITDSSNLREGASEAFEKAEDEATEPVESPKSIERAFKLWYPTWDGYDLDSEPKSRAAWFALTAEERRLAAERSVEYQQRWKKNGKTHKLASSTYLTEKRWEKLPPKPVEPAKTEIAKPMGKAWMAIRLSEFHKPMVPEGAWPPAPIFVRRTIEEGGEAGERQMMARRARYGWPKVYDLNVRRTENKPVLAAPEMMALGAYFVSVEISGPVGQAWQRLHARMKLDWLPGEPDYAYFPPIDPGADDLDRAVAAAFWGLKERIEGYVQDAAQ